MLARYAILAVFLSMFTNYSYANDSIYVYESNQGEIYFSDEVEHQGFRSYSKPTTPKAEITNITQAISHYAASYRVDPLLIKAVIKAESNFNPQAKSRKGALGLMQIMPNTAQMLNLRDPYNATDNIRAGTTYLSQLIGQFGGDIHLALAAYNAGPTIVKKLGGIPPYPETIHYIQQVLLYYNQFKPL